MRGISLWPQILNNRGYNIILVWSVRAVVKALLTYLALLVAPAVSGAIKSYITGDDFWYYENLPFPLVWVRYVVTDKGTIYDFFTGLEWIPDPSGLGGVWGSPGAPAKMSWQNAIDACKTLFHGGYNDWRLPNRKELESIIDYGKSGPAIDTDKFPNTQDDGYHSSSVTHYGCENYWFTNFETGITLWDQDLDKERYVRPVRGRPARRWLGTKRGRR
jgi:hypothetical protein